jgi:hypothetical protein
MHYPTFIRRYIVGITDSVVEQLSEQLDACVDLEDEGYMFRSRGPGSIPGTTKFSEK